MTKLRSLLTPLEDERRLKARLDFVLASLPMGAVMNPAWSVLFVIPFGGTLPAFGTIPLSAIACIVALHIVCGAVGILIRQWARREEPPPGKLFQALLLFQTTTAAAWSASAVLLWIDGNETNNILVALIMIGNMWGLVITRGYHPQMFNAGLSMLVAGLWYCAFANQGQAAELLIFLAPVFGIYAWMMGNLARSRVDELLATRFALEDTAIALESARADAVAKAAEVEAASASKTAFVANMSHELRTPLNAILGFSEIIETAAVGPDISAQYRAYGHDIHRSGNYLLSLINDMLDVAKIEAGKMEIHPVRIDGKRAIEGAVRLVAHRAKQKAQTLSVRVDSGLELFGDERAFKQILINLLSNAVKFSAEGTAIEVDCSVAADGNIRLSIADRGPGIPDDKIKQLFRPFSRVDNTYEHATGGTGLGLALVRGLVNLHGGTITLRNRPTGGLIVQVDLPGRETRAAA